LNMEYKIEFTDKEITPWSGILMMIKMLEKMQFCFLMTILGLCRYARMHLA
jgi:hypothetical protein